MSFQEKRVSIYMLTSVVIYSIYAWKMLGYHAAGRFEAVDATVFAGKAILVLIAAYIAAAIVGQIIFHIGVSIAEREEHHDQTDERDKLFEARASTVAHYIAGVGFVIGMIMLAFAYPAYLVFNFLVLSNMLGDFVGNIFKLRLYRGGN